MVESLKEKVLRITLEELDLSVRSYNCLKRAGINTVKDLLHTVPVSNTPPHFIPQRATANVPSIVVSTEYVLTPHNNHQSWMLLLTWLF